MKETILLLTAQSQVHQKDKLMVLPDELVRRTWFWKEFPSHQSELKRDHCLTVTRVPLNLQSLLLLEAVWCPPFQWRKGQCCF